MAEKKPFIMLSLEEKSIKKIAEVIGSETAQKILNYLANNASATETEIAKELNLPISTVNYNMKNLTASTLVSSNEFHYSEKGKEVNHYTLSNKYIIIAPKGQEGKSPADLKSMLFTGLAVAAASAGIILFPKIKAVFSALGSNREQMLLSTAAKSAADSSAGLLSAQAPAAMAFSEAASPALWPWFLGGAIFALAIYTGIIAIRTKRD